MDGDYSEVVDNSIDLPQLVRGELVRDVDIR